MAEHDRRSYRTRDPVAPRSSQASARAQVDDPLAELAGLIGQKGPINDLGRDERYDPVARFDEQTGDPGPAIHDEYAAPKQPIQDHGAARSRYSPHDTAREPSLAMRPPPPPPPAPNANALRDESRGYAGARSEAFPSRSADSRYEDDVRYEDGGHHEDDNRYEDDSDYAHDDDGNDSSDDHAYADDHSYAGEDYEDEASNGRKRGGFILVTAIFALAVLGTAGAFAYRTIFGDSMLPSLPPIIKAESGPNKIVPTAASGQGKVPGQADANSGGSGEKLVSRQEQPVDIPASASGAPRMVSTVPIFPDSAPGIGPGSAATGYPIGPMASAPTVSAPMATGSTALGSAAFGNPAVHLAPPNPAAAAPSTPAPSAAPDRGPAAANQPPQSGPATAVPAPVIPGAKKIHTVAIHSDQADAPDAAPSAPPASPDSPPRAAAPQQRAPKPSSSPDANGPLTIVPSAGDTAPPAAAHPRSAPPHPVPLNTAAATTNESAAPAAAGGGYAVQVSSQRSEAEAQASFRALQAKYPDVLGGRQPIVRRADLGAKGVYYRALVGPFASAEEAAGMCSNLKAAGGSCLVQKN
jgi:SPOR domain